MKYLTGATNNRDEPILIEAGVGLMIQPGNSYHLRIGRYPYWAADIGMKPTTTVDDYVRWLECHPYLDRCLFAVSPDAYPDAKESIRRGLEYAPVLRDLGYPVAIVAQDGSERMRWPWADLDCVFIGGERRKGREWKTSPEAELLVRQARYNGKWVHMGRVNSIRRLERARAMGCNSCDGTFIKYWRRKLAKEDSHNRDGSQVVRWLAYLDANRMLPPFSAFETPSHPIHRQAAMEAP